MNSLNNALRHMRFVSAALDGDLALRAEEARRKEIAEAAYFRALQRGFSPGHEREDWLEAEREVDARRYP